MVKFNKSSSRRYFMTILLFMGILSISRANTPVRLIDQVKSDFHLDSLTTQICPSAYLFDEEVTVKEIHPVKIYVDTPSIPMLYQDDSLYETVEIVIFKIKTAKDEAAILDVGKFTSFANLKYILFEYEYASCGSEKDDTCLIAKIASKILNNSNSSVQILYKLSIPK